MNLRRAVPEDAAALGLVGIATFLESYALSLPGKDLTTHVLKNHDRSVYDAWLVRDDVAIWVVEAGEGRTVIGYAVLTPPDLPESQPEDLELRRIYVLSKFQGQGMGRRLLEKVAAEAKRRGASRLTLGMYGENHAALAFYRHVGFRQIGTREFQVGDKRCSDYVLGLDLR